MFTSLLVKSNWFSQYPWTSSVFFFPWHLYYSNSASLEWSFSLSTYLISVAFMKSSFIWSQWSITYLSHLEHTLHQSFGIRLVYFKLLFVLNWFLIGQLGCKGFFFLQIIQFYIRARVGWDKRRKKKETRRWNREKKDIEETKMCRCRQRQTRGGVGVVKVLSVRNTSPST